jgi:predicted transcriptional regulator
MTTVTISLPDESMLRLKEISGRLNVSMEKLVQASIEDMLARPDEMFQQAVEYILQKNLELYRQLAA